MTITHRDMVAILESVQSNSITISEAMEKISWNPVKSLGQFANLDNSREIRQGVPEFIYAESKTPEEVSAIAVSQYEDLGRFLASRTNEEHAKAVIDKLPDTKYNKRSKIAKLGSAKPITNGNILVIAAGTSDLHAAEEAVDVLNFLGHKVSTVYDIGVAAIHRIAEYSQEIQTADVIIVAAGMEGALPTVIGGLVSVPVIALPTSVGYGISMNGITALHAMLNTCVPGITVVNIDNGLGAAVSAHRIINHFGRILHN